LAIFEPDCAAAVKRIRRHRRKIRPAIIGALRCQGLFEAGVGLSGRELLVVLDFVEFELTTNRLKVGQEAGLFDSCAACAKIRRKDTRADTTNSSHQRNLNHCKTDSRFSHYIHPISREYKTAYLAINRARTQSLPAVSVAGRFVPPDAAPQPVPCYNGCIPLFDIDVASVHLKYR